MQPKVRIFDPEEIQKAQARSNSRYFEFLRVPAMSSGLYVLAAGSNDPQKPHHEDEVYYVLKGRAHFYSADAEGETSDHEVRTGAVIFVAAGVEHRFHDIAEDLTVLVFFAPAES